MDVCIKNIGDESWRSFKSESVKHGLKLGVFFSKLVFEHQEKCNGSNWDKAPHGKKVLKGLLSKKDIVKIQTEFRENFKMRERS